MSIDRDRQTWDVIVIGAGPAGALTALLAARAGASTLLIERKRFPRAKVCGSCLNASAVALLESHGLGAITREFGLPVDELVLGLRGKRARLGLPGGVAIPRTHLDAELVRNAVLAGATFLQETSASLGPDTGTSRQVTILTHDSHELLNARCVVLASGLGNSPLGSSTEFATRVAPGSRLGAGCLVATVMDAYPEGRISMAVGRSGYVGLTPTVDGLTVAAAFDASFLKHHGSPAKASAAILDEAGFPAVPAMLSASWSGTLPLTRKTRPVAASRVFLVGDSAGYVEPFTGQGMAIALQGAAALVPYLTKAVAGWSSDLATGWSREYERKVGSRHWPASLIAAIARRPAIARVAFTLVESVPSIPGIVVRAVNRPTLPHPVPSSTP